MGRRLIPSFVAEYSTRGGTSAKTMGQPDDVGGVVAALLTPDMAFVNGQRIEVTGGFFL